MGYNKISFEVTIDVCVSAHGGRRQWNRPGGTLKVYLSIPARELEFEIVMEEPGPTTMLS